METKTEKKKEFHITSIVRLLCPLSLHGAIPFGVVTDCLTSNEDYPIYEITIPSHNTRSLIKETVTLDMIEKVPQEEWTTEQIQFRALIQCPEERRLGLLWEWLRRKPQNIGPLDIVKPMSGCNFIKHDLLTVEYIKNDRAHCLCGVKLQYKMSLPLEVLDLVHKHNPVPDKWDEGVQKIKFGNSYSTVKVKEVETFDMSEAFKETLLEKIKPKVTV